MRVSLRDLCLPWRAEATKTSNLFFAHQEAQTKVSTPVICSRPVKIEVDGKIMARFDHYLNAKLILRRDLTDDLMIVKLQPEQPIAFFPGQFCTLALDGVAKPYSMVSSPDEGALELFIERVPEGPMTVRLWRLKEGDSLKVMPRAKGLFFFEESFKNHLMVCTVTGVAPFMSMIRYFARRGQLGSFRIKIFQGASYQQEFGYAEELSELDRRGLISYVPTVSRPSEDLNRGWRGDKEKVHVLFEHYLEDLPPSTQDTMVYVCGHPGMIREVAAMARGRGYPFKEEKYFVLREARS